MKSFLFVLLVLTAIACNKNTHQDQDLAAKPTPIPAGPARGGEENDSTIEGELPTKPSAAPAASPASTPTVSPASTPAAPSASAASAPVSQDALVENLKAGEVSLKLLSVEMANALCEDRNLALGRGVLKYVDMNKLTGEVLLSMYLEGNSKLRRDLEFTLVSVEKEIEDQNQTFMIVLSNPEAGLITMAVLAPGLELAFTLNEWKKALEPLFELQVKTKK